MKEQSLLRKLVFIIVLVLPFSATAQNNIGAFKAGEWLQYKLRYGIINAGYASLTVQDTLFHNKPSYIINGLGWTTGMVRFFFKVQDNYQSIIDKNTIQPYLFKRRVNEGGYTIIKDIRFSYRREKALVIDYKNHTQTDYKIVEGVQDMISSMYFLRNTDLSHLKINQEISINLFYDQQLNNFKMRFLGKAIIDTKFGKIKTLMFKPFVESGRVFKDQNSVVVWVSDDENKIPLKIKADLVVGSLKAELDSFKGLANGFPVIYN